MAVQREVLRNIPLFALLDDEETDVLATQVDLKTFAPRERIYKAGDPASAAFVVISGKVRVFTLDEDHQEVVVDEPGSGEFFGFASMLEQTSHQTNALTISESACLEVSRGDIEVLLTRKPMAGMDLLTTLGRQLHAAQGLVRGRASRNSNDLIEKEATTGERIVDHVAAGQYGQGNHGPRWAGS
jgi:CRP-like cAMP-binding protein